MVFNNTFNNLSDISWWSVLLVEETGKPRENHPPVGGHWQTFIAKIYSIEYTSPWVGMELTSLVVMCTDCICICKSNLQYQSDKVLKVVLNTITMTLPNINTYTQSVSYDDKNTRTNLWCTCFIQVIFVFQ
jgi:hypothetical protein